MTELMGRQVVTSKAVVDHTTQRRLAGELVRTFTLGPFTYGVIRRFNGDEGTAMLDDIRAVDP